jgi:hypothetical protein
VKASENTYASSRGGDNEANRFKLFAVKIFPRVLKEDDQMLLKRLRLFEQKGEEDAEML